MTEKIALRTDRLKEAREQQGWSQRELARLCGLGEALVNKYENGHTDPSATYLGIIAEKLGVSADYLLGLTDDPHGYVGGGELSEQERTIIDAFRRDGWNGILSLIAARLTR